jgi:hypothetical protein
VALISALGALLLLTPLVLALLSMSTFELLISRNLLEATQALFTAEAGIEWAFNRLVNTPDWNALLGPEATIVSGQPSAAVLVVPSDLLPRAGMTITLGKAARPTDLTVTSTGTVNRAQRTITAIIRRDAAIPSEPSGSEAPAFDRHAFVSWREH